MKAIIGQQDKSHEVLIECLKESIGQNHWGQAKDKALILNPCIYELPELIESHWAEVKYYHEWFQDHQLLSTAHSQFALTWTHLYSEDFNQYDFILFKLNKSKAFNLKLLELLKDYKGCIWVWGTTDEGIKSFPKKAASFGFDVDCLLNRQSSRVLELSPGSLGISPEKDDIIRDGINLDEFVDSVSGVQAFSTVSLNSVIGCFGHNKADQGSELMMEVLRMDDDIQDMTRDSKEHSVLDIGTGSGVLTFSLAQLGLKNITAVDAHSLAIESFELNQAALEPHNQEIQCHWGDRAEGFKGPFQLILTNPPFHEGKQTNTHMGQEWLRSLRAKLSPGGVVFLVCNSFLKYEQWADGSFSQVEVVKKKYGFSVLKMIV